MKIKKLENWSVVSVGISPYDAPETNQHCLHGINEGGNQIVTSSIVSYEKDCVLTRSGSLYLLEEIDPDYEKLYPDAKNRLFKALKKFS